MKKEEFNNEWFSEGKAVVADWLFDIGAIKFGAFRLKLHEKNPDAPLSPIYVDLRLLRSFPAAMDDVVNLFNKMSDKITAFDCYADVPTAATPIVAVLSNKTRIPMITPREAKTHGGGASIDGVFNRGQIVLVIDDLVTKADSKLEAIRTLEAGGLKVHDVLVLVDREQGGPEQLQKAGYNLHVAFKLSELLQYYLDQGKIDKTKYDEVIAYQAATK
ncbi:MAG: hypothetical protein PHF44_03540 [Candidatus Pacebacteria bacterium]|nr:hypothetical protein [Candidatus Paceibacterota bacterium]